MAEKKVEKKSKQKTKKEGLPFILRVISPVGALYIVFILIFLIGFFIIY